MPVRLVTAVLSVVALLWPTPSAHAQRTRPLLGSSDRAELDEAERQAALADGIYTGGGLVGGAGVLTLLGSSIALGACAGRCASSDIFAAELALGLSGGLVATGLITLLVATFVDGDAERWRRRILARDMGFWLLPRGAGGPVGWMARW